MTETRKEKFLNNLYNTKMGSISKDQYVYAPISNARQMDDPDWELRFSLFPDQENINKAAEAIADLLLDEKIMPYDLAFKIINFNKITDSTQLNSWRTMGAEGHFTTLEGLSDRDQRGKEFCLYLRFKKTMGAPEKSPREWKEIILKIWKALHNAKIKMGYINPQIGDISLSSETVTPISYVHAINRNWTNLTTLFWEILHREDVLLNEKKEHDNKITMKQRPLLTDQLYEIDWKKYENKKINPLAGIHITLQDLEKSGISYTSIYQMQQDKIAYLQDHSADAVSWVTNELTNMVEDVKEMPHETLKSLIFEKLFLLETIVTQLEKNSLQDTLVEQMRQVVDDIAMLIPREDKYGILRLPSQIDELINMRLDFNKRKMQSGYFAGFLKRITSARQYIEDEYTKEKLAEVYQRIYQLYNQDRSILKFLNDLKIDNTLLVNMIAMRPGEMELQYRHLREIKKEKFMLQEAEHTLKFMLTTDEVALRKSMSTFIHDIIQSMSFCNRVFGSGKSWISLKDKARICVNREKLQELFQEIRNTSIQTSCIQKYYQLLASPKYTDLKLFYISEESRSYRLLNRN